MNKYPYNLLSHLMGIEMKEDDVTIDMLEGLHYALEDLIRRYNWERNISMYRDFWESDFDENQISKQYDLPGCRTKQIIITVTRSLKRWYSSYYTKGFMYTCNDLYEQGLLCSIDPADINMTVLSIDTSTILGVLEYTKKSSEIDFINIGATHLSEKVFVVLYRWVICNCVSPDNLDPTVWDVVREINIRLYPIYRTSWYRGIDGMTKIHMDEIERVCHFNEYIENRRRLKI